MRKLLLPAFLAAVTVALVVTTSAFAATPRSQLVRLHDAEGHAVGTVRLTALGQGVVRVRASVHSMPAGFHGFHIHSVGSCEPPFTTAGPHFNTNAASHPNHAGDMPVLYVTDDGKGRSEFITNRFGIGDILDADGSAVIIHANPDNYANIPTDRYEPDPDAMTHNTGDAGGRIVCGVIGAAASG